MVQTPSDPDDSISIKHVLAACKEVGSALRHTNGYGAVVIGSTVMPGHTNGPILRCLEEASGRKAHTDFGLCYCPEFVRRGSIVRDFSDPAFVLVGYETDGEVDLVLEYYMALLYPLEWKPLLVSIESAEIAKIGINTALTAKMARANELALLCHFTPGASAAQVLHVVGSDPRIGQANLHAGPIPGGPCFTRDSPALAAAMRARRLRSHLTTGVIEFEVYLTEQLASIISAATKERKPVGILGLAYKPQTDSPVGSPGLALAKILRVFRDDVVILAYDPAVPSPVSYVKSVASLEALVTACDTIVLMTCWPEFQELGKLDLMGKVLVDVWGFVKAPPLGCRYIRFGEGGER
jgi:UDPglucose 6-dehydrogenase